MSSGESDATGRAEYTIDQLAALSGVPSRTIRFYQSKGALPRPTIRGRVAYYGPKHNERLKLIATLQDRGLQINAIRDLVSRVDAGQLDLNEWLGVDARMRRPLSDDRPKLMEESELYQLCGSERPGLLAELSRLGMIEKKGGSYLVPSPGLLAVAGRLNQAGVDLDTAHGAHEILRKHMERSSHDLANYFLKRAGEGFGRDVTPGDLGDAIEALKSTGVEAVVLIFSQEMQRVIAEVSASGKAAAVTARAKQKKSKH